MDIPFIYKNSIILNLLRTAISNFTMHTLAILKRSLKMYSSEFL